MPTYVLATITGDTKAVPGIYLVSLAQFVLVQPSAFVPDEHQIIGKIPPQPLV